MPPYACSFCAIKNKNCVLKCSNKACGKWFCNEKVRGWIFRGRTDSHRILSFIWSNLSIMRFLRTPRASLETWLSSASSVEIRTCLCWVSWRSKRATNRASFLSVGHLASQIKKQQNKVIQHLSSQLSRVVKLT